MPHLHAAHRACWDPAVQQPSLLPPCSCLALRLPYWRRLQAEMHVHDAYDFSDDEGVPPFREQLSLAAKRSHGGGKQAAGKRGRAH